jgi:threonine/homoserine/homoserine lactone efflux protein
MDATLFFRGLLLGFAIAAPVGPIGLLVIQRTLNDGRLVGLLSGLGAATADAIYGAVAAFGLSLLTAFLVEQQLWLGLAGGLFLCYLGVRTVMAPPAVQAITVESRGLLGAWSTTLALTLTNPMTILAFVAIFAGAGLATASGNTLAALLLVTGVFLGSAAWWLLLSGGVALLRAFVNAQTLRWINWIAGGVIVAFGVLAILRGIGWV